ncbi:MAG: magnesium/cobalt transporter CorA [Phycisphaeraceae bacterium]|nr:magnesium/cobalt transporter CorA [Phycisphaeraceae bacterium]MCB9848837.1 magnesium/cobalt transporter CorA [Phycisphaeraceae bacterium]
MVPRKAAKLFRRHRAPVAAPPGTVVAQADASPTRIHVIWFESDGFEEREVGAGEDLHAMIRPDRTLWIDIRGMADIETIRGIGAVFGVSPLAIADIINVGQRPKTEDLANALLTIARMVTLDEAGRLHWEQVSFVVGEGFLLTFQETPVDCFEPVRVRIRQNGPVVRKAGPDLLSVLLLDAVVDGYFPVIEEFGERLEELETIVLTRPVPSVMSEIYHVKRELSLFRRAAWPLRDALSRSLTERTRFTGPETQPYLHDVRDHILQVVDVLESYRELATSLIEVYLSSVSNRTNEVMRVLTIIATIFIPLGFLAGVYGMNFDTSDPGNMPELSWRHGYLFFWIVAISIVVGLLGLFWRLGWMRSAEHEGKRR